MMPPNLSLEATRLSRVIGEVVEPALRSGGEGNEPEPPCASAYIVPNGKCL